LHPEFIHSCVQSCRPSHGDTPGMTSLALWRGLCYG
jgi:hypothetical protein